MAPQVDPEFGPLLVSKKFPRELIFPVVGATFLFSLFAYFLISSARGQFGAHRPLTSRLPELALFGVFSGLFFALILHYIYRMVQRVHFYQAGAVQTLFGRTVASVAYADCVTHKFSAVHLSKNDSYQGTFTKLYLTGSNKQAVRYLARHKLESVRNGGFFTLGFQVVGANPIWGTAWRSASDIAGGWISRLEAGQSVEWTKLATLTPTGVASWRGPTKGTLALYSELAPISFEGTDAVIALRDGTLVLKIPTRKVNFYPGYLAACAMIDRVSPDSETIDEDASRW